MLMISDVPIHKFRNDLFYIQNNCHFIKVKVNERKTQADVTYLGSLITLDPIQRSELKLWTELQQQVAQFK